ncbi:hypothetical protein CRI94_10205 [Longibacter salinarum]|uniref:DUF2459 domain-containing protein n=1 Tax=Longibacter salinarum TaxID=1850348 RepID=A0A2A8CXA5_9BACT|nr:DUF2459 domain-containing protein [Longibacter salinarum]PEN13018.1 hypothetical protein CRI94_10205 [Longibacter salinarum]
MPAFLNWRRVVAVLVIAWSGLLMVSCGLPHVTVEDDGPPVHDIYVVEYGWHAGIIIPTQSLPSDALPAFPGVPASPFIDVGWGEARYYPSSDPGTLTLLRAGLWPTSSVVYVVPIYERPPPSSRGSKTVRLRVSDAELRAMANAIRSSMRVTEDGSAIFAAEGHAQNSRFFESPLSYHVFNNCNHWAAAVLRAAGCDTWPRYTLTVDRVMRQAEECSRR